jgi:hypothetical protein
LRKIGLLQSKAKWLMTRAVKVIIKQEFLHVLCPDSDSKLGQKPAMITRPVAKASRSPPSAIRASRFRRAIDC